MIAETSVRGTRLLTDRSGSSLAVVLILVFVTLVALAAVFQLGVQDASLATKDEDRIQALFLAEAGLSEGLGWLRAQDMPPSGVSPLQPLGAEPDTLLSGTYSVTIQPDPANPGRSRKEYTLASTGMSHGKSRTLTRRVATRSFASYIYFTDLECIAATGAPIWFATSDRLTGSVHTNGHIHMMGNPYFGGHVTSAWGGPGDPDSGHNPSFVYNNAGFPFESTAPDNAPYDVPTFEAGYELGAGYVDFPEYVDDLKVLAQANGLYLDGNYKVQFGREVDGAPLLGYVSYMPLRDGSWVDVDLSTFNGIIFVDGSCRVWGELDGVATVGSQGDMLIMDDIVYVAADPVDGPYQGCDDVLGLVSQQNIIVDNNSATQDDCNIHAHMMALNTSFTVEDYSAGSPRGNLTVHGGIVQKYRGPVGTGYISGGDVVIRTGYSKNYNFDPRFRDSAPPGYLSTGTYELLAWNEVISD